MPPAATGATALRDVSLDDKYELESGRVFSPACRRWSAC